MVFYRFLPPRIYISYKSSPSLPRASFQRTRLIMWSCRLARSTNCPSNFSPYRYIYNQLPIIRYGTVPSLQSGIITFNHDSCKLAKMGKFSFHKFIVHVMRDPENHPRIFLYECVCDEFFVRQYQYQPLLNQSMQLFTNLKPIRILNRSIQ